jgi:acetyl/propionyl-CoA carboxylase alpha subunit
LCAEDPNTNFALSIGKITEFHVPGGNGVRVDTSISTTSSVVVGSDFDNMIAKVIVTAATWDGVIAKTQRVLADMRIGGVKTNVDVLRGILAAPEFTGWKVDTQWLESELGGIIERGAAISNSIRPSGSSASAGRSLAQSISGGSSSTMFRRGDAWSLELEPLNAKGGSDKSQIKQRPHHLHITRVLRNEFPASLSAEIEYTTPAAAGARATTTPYRMTLSTTASSASSMSSTHRLGDPNNKSHIILPMSGKLTEVLVEEGDEVEENTVIAFVKQMKMELEVRSSRAGRITWALELEDGDDVPEGVLLAELEPTSGPSRQPVEVKGKL